MAVIPRQKARYAGRIGGGAPPVRHFPVEGEADFEVGDFVKLHTSGSERRLVACTTGDSEAIGMALESASSTEGTKQPVLLAEGDVIFEINVSHDTAESAVTSEALVGGKYGLEVSSHRAYCKIDDTTNKFFQVHELSPRDNTGDQYGRVLVRVLSDVYQLGPGEKTQ
ncbi:MAG: hypothetical protein J7M18_08805 [Candidatus Eremiobacteraeota bacterium]|nr:hypothetical protein [Candidatus Eremiobacteraeota bacterium]